MRDKFRGSLIGTALGDAVGFMVEKQMPETCANYIQNKYMTGDIIGHTRSYKGKVVGTFGQYSDDTQLSRELMLSLTECGGWQPEDYVDKLVTIFDTGRIVGAGTSTRIAVSNLLTGVHWKDAGTPPPAAGNGTAMRAAPIGLFFENEYDLIIKCSKEQSIMTHSDERCQSGAVLIALAASLAMTEAYTTPRQFLDALMAITASNDALDPVTYNALLVLDDALDKDFNEAVQMIAALDKERLVQEWKWISPYVTTTVMWSLWSFLNNMDNFEAAMISSIVCGGDVDSTAAITGAIAGAYLGLDGVPDRYLDSLHDNGQWKKDRLIEVADNCYEAANG